MAIMPFSTGSHRGESLAIDTEELVNVYPRVSETGKSVISLISRPGLERAYNFGAASIRASLIVTDATERYVLYVVVGNNFIRQPEGGMAEYKGGLTTSAGRCHMEWNGVEVLVTDGVNGYVYNTSTDVFVQLDLGTHGWSLGQPTYCTFLSQYLVVLDEGDNSYHVSAPRDALSWNAADKAGAETDPDGIRHVIANNGELWIFGPRSLEVHYVNGDPNPATFPFTPKLSATLDLGCAAADSVSEYNNSLAFLSQSRRGGLRVYWMNGYTPQRISDDALEHTLRGYSKVSDAIGMGFDWKSGAFYVLTFPTEGVSWMYDARSAQWCQLKTGTGRWAGQIRVGVENIVLISDYRDGRLYQLAEREDDDGEPIRVRVVGKTINDQEQRITHRNLEVVVERGTAGQSIDPVMRLRWSNDNGNTWSASYSRTMGRVGRYRDRARWNRLGRVRNRTYELLITDSAPKVIVGMVVNGVA